MCLLVAVRKPALWCRRLAVRSCVAGRGGVEADGDGQGVEAALFDAARIGVLPPALGAPDAIGNAVDQRPELGAEHPVERGVRHEHPVVAITEVQAPPAALAQVLLVQVGGILLLLRPVLDLPPGPVGRHGGHLRQQRGILVDGLGACRRRGPGQSIGVLRRDVTLGERLGDLRHLGEGAGPLTAPPRLAMRAARVVAQHLHGIHAAVAKIVQSGHSARLGRIGTRTHPTQRGHQSPQHAPPGTLQREATQLRHESLHQTENTPHRVRSAHEHDPRQRPAASVRLGQIAPGRGRRHLGLSTPPSCGQVPHVRHSTEGV